MMLKDYLLVFDIETTKFAEHIHVSRSYASQLIHGHKSISKEMAKRIEEATDHHVTRLELLYPEEYTTESEEIIKNI